MSRLLGFPPMAKPKGEVVTVKISAAVYRKAKMIAAHRDVTLADYLSDVLLKPVDRDYQKVKESMEGESSPGS